MKWRKEMSQSSEDSKPLNSDQNKDAKIQQRIGEPIKSDVQTDKLEELTKLYKSQNMDNKEILSKI